MKNIFLTCAMCVISCNVLSNTKVENGIKWNYSIIEDGVAITNSVIPDSVTNIDIPDTIDGLPVVEISSKAVQSTNRLFITNASGFNEASSYVNVYYTLKLPSKLRRIKSMAFFERKFKSLEFPETLEELDQFAFGWLQVANKASNGTINGYGMWPIEGIEQVIFWGQPPIVKNESNLSYSKSFSSYSDNYMFWKGSGATIVYVDEYYYGSIWQYSASYNKSFRWFGYGHVSIGFTSTHVSRQPQAENGYGNKVVLTSTSTNSVCIYYTIDGSEPVNKKTENCFLYEGEELVFACNRTIKSIAYCGCYPYTKVVTKDFGVGNAVNPTYSSSDGKEFWSSGNIISISSTTVDSTIRYTLDNSAVTEQSPIYTGPITISDTTIVRAKAFKEDWFDSDEVVQKFTRLWYTNEVPVITAATNVFDSAAQEVTLDCETDGAEVYYTLDGSEPSKTNGRRYKGPFNVYDSCVVKAVAVKDDWKDSAVASASFTKNNSLSAALNMLNYLPETASENPWYVVNDVTYDGMSAVRSGAVSADGGSTHLQVTVRGAGRLSFWWKTACEEESDGAYYDYAVFKVGGKESALLAGVTDWQQFVTNITTTGKHVLKWEYVKDDADSVPPDCVWVDQVQWMPADDSGYTLTTETPIPYSWLAKYGFGNTNDFEKAAREETGKRDGAGYALTAEDEYIVGTDPTNSESRLTAKVTMEDGKPVVTWEPDLNEGGTKSVRKYTTYGCEELGGEWVDMDEVEEDAKARYHFFKVGVEMP